MKRILVSVLLAAIVPLGAMAAQAAKTPGQRIAIEVTKKAFEPALVSAKAGQPLTLAVTRKVEKTCATEIMVKKLGIRQTLPPGKTVEVRLPPQRPGELRFACGMDMLAGKLVVE
jgi:plastocyanin domain-containing protein